MANGPVEVIDSSNVDTAQFAPDAAREQPGTGGIFDIMNDAVLTEQSTQRHARDIALLRQGSAEGVDWVTEFDQAFSEIQAGADPQQMKNNASFEFAQATDNRISTFIQQNITSKDANIQDAVSNALINRELIKQEEIDKVLDSDGTEKAIAEMYASETSSEFRKRQDAVRNYALSVTMEWAEDRGTGQAVWDWLTHAFGPDEFKDAADLIGKGDFFASDERLRLIQEFQSLDPEFQKPAFEALFPRIIDAYDDNTEAVPVFVSTLFARDYVGEVALEEAAAALNLIDFGTIGAAATISLGTRLAGRVAKPKPRQISDIKANNAAGAERSVPKNLESVGNHDAAAESATMAGLDPKSSNLLGMARLDSAMTASPFRLDEISLMGTSIDNLADKMVQMHRASVEATIGRRTAELTQLRKGTTTDIARNVEVALEELPREIAALRQSIGTLDRGIKARKGRVKQADIAERNFMQVEIENQATMLRRLETQLIRAEKVAAKRQRIDDLNTELITLRSGHVPDPIAAAVREAVGNQQTVRAGALIRSPKMQELRQAEAAKLAASTSDDVAEAVLSLRTGRVAERIVDDHRALGLSEEFVEDLKNTFRIPISGLAGQVEEIAPDALTAAERKISQERVINKIVREAEQANESIRVGTVTELSKDAFTVRFTRGGIDNNLEYKYTMSDTGVFEGVSTGALKNVKSFMKSVLSPEVRFARVGGFTGDFTFAGDQAARIGTKLQKIDQEITKGFSAQQREDLDSLLMAGDENKRVFTVEELEAGMAETKFAIKAHEPAVIEAYYKKRAMLDELHSLREHTIKRHLEFLGYKSGKYLDDAGEQVDFLAKPRDTFRGADLEDQTSIWIPNGVAAGDSAYSNMKAIRANMEVWKNEGYEIVELLEPHTFKDGSTVKFGLVADGFGVKLRDVPQNVLNYQPGYVPRIYRSGYHFVKDITDPARPRTLFATETAADAEKFANQMIDFMPGRKLTFKADRELNAFDKIVIDADEYGGLYTGSRKDNLLLVKTTGDTYRPERVGTGEAIQRYMSNVSTLLPMAEYRTTIMQRWVNSVEALAGKTHKGLIDKRDLNSPIDLPKGQQELMEDARDYITTQLRMQTNDEKAFNNLMQTWSDSLFTGSGKTAKARELARAVTIGMIDKDPVQAIKGFTFNMQLGMFNVRQLAVQIQNAAIASAVDPKHAPAALADALAMRTFVLGARKDWDTLAGGAAKITGRSKEELKELVDLFDKTGLYDSIKRTADYDAQIVSMGGSTMAGIRKAAQAGRVFFTEGELMARLISFNIARRRLGPKAGVRELFDEHLRLSMNMQSANAAVWQKNWLGIPLQYMQVFTKFYERAIPGLLKKPGAKWSRKEAAQVLGAQFALYGTVGVPIAEEAYAFLADQQGKTPAQMQREMPLVQEMFDEGLTGVMATLMGFENNFSKDFSIVSGTFENNATDLAKGIWDAIHTGSSGVDAFRLFTGPSASMTGRIVDAGSSVWQAAYVLKETPSVETLGTQTLNVLDNFAAITSTWSAARKAIFLHDQGIVSKRGNTIIEADRFSDISLQTMFARAMNFETDIETAYWDLKDLNRTSRQYQNQDMAALKKAQLQFIRTGDIKSLKAIQAHILLGKTPAEQSKMMERATLGLTGDSDYDRQVETHTREYILSGGRKILHPATAN